MIVINRKVSTSLAFELFSFMFATKTYLHHFSCPDLQVDYQNIRETPCIVVAGHILRTDIPAAEIIVFANNNILEAPAGLTHQVDGM